MINLEKINYQINSDLQIFMASELLNIDELAKILNLSKNTLYEVLNGMDVNKEVNEKICSYFYNCGYRFNQAKENILKEENKLVLFHGSKSGLRIVSNDGSRSNCDFGKGFYLGESFYQALSFISDFDESSIYSFYLDIEDLNVYRFKENIEWVLAICYFRGKLDKYKNNKIIKDIIKKVNSADVIVAPIADNKMFHIMDLFIEGEINVNITLHSLVKASLGNQYVIKSNKALNKLTVIEKYYVSNLEKEEALNKLINRVNDIDENLKLNKRKYREGQYIEEILK